MRRLIIAQRIIPAVSEASFDDEAGSYWSRPLPVSQMCRDERGLNVCRRQGQARAMDSPRL